MLVKGPDKQPAAAHAGARWYTRWLACVHACIISIHSVVGCWDLPRANCWLRLVYQHATPVPLCTTTEDSYEARS